MVEKWFFWGGATVGQNASNPLVAQFLDPFWDIGKNPFLAHLTEEGPEAVQTQHKAGQ